MSQAYESAEDIDMEEEESIEVLRRCLTTALNPNSVIPNHHHNKYNSNLSNLKSNNIPNSTDLITDSKAKSKTIRLTEDFTDSPYHRFRNAGSKNCRNIYPPSATLHVSNIPDWAGECDVRPIFEKAGYPMHRFWFLPCNSEDPGSKKMALVELESREAGVEALSLLHNAILADKYTLKVSFARPRFF
ncbi:unnamed protein product [Gordionus sp. m RMFG-2023]